MDIDRPTNQIDIRQGGISDFDDILAETFASDQVSDELQGLIDETFSSNPVTMRIDNKKTTCKKDIEVCCKKKCVSPPPPPIPPKDPKPPIITTPPLPRPQECGIHNSEGLGVTASFPSDGQAR